jgi:hypothetical protein
MAGKMAGEWDAVNKAHRLLAQHTAEEPLTTCLVIRPLVRCM